MKIEIKNRWSGAVLFSIETDNWKLAVEAAVSQGVSLYAADLTDANLTGANLTDANLRRANLTRANLTDANLTDADLTDANLTGANLTGADLTGADLTRADLTDADLTDANLTGANLRRTRDDIWAVLSSSPKEVEGLRLALAEGRVDGSAYTGDCACLVGTLANVAQCDYEELPTLKPDSSRPAERFFLAIKTGDTPANSQPARLAVEWIDEWLSNIRDAFGPNAALTVKE